MRKICYKFQKTILFLMMMIIYLGNYLAFFLLLGIDNQQMLGLSRTSVVITFTWVILIWLLTSIYGRYDVGIRKPRPIITSLMLTTFITDVAGYLLLNIMNRNDDNNQTFKIEFIGIFLAILIIHAIWITLWTYIGNGFYFGIQAPMSTLIILSDAADEKRLRRMIGKYHKRYRVERVMLHTDADVLKAIDKVQSVFLYDVPIAERTLLVNECYRRRKNIHFNPEIADILVQCARQSMFDDMTFLASEETGMTFEQRIMKRMIDIVISLIALLVFSPVFLIAAIGIKKCDGGPVFFRQERATLNGKVFSIYKFRTMRVDAGNRSVTKDDDRITPIGHFLRKYRLDEIPQFINILKGEMSVVGPRPEMMENVQKYTADMPEFSYRLRMKAGLTGYAQILGKYNTTSKDKLVLDLLYIENFSIVKDIQLIFQTVLVLLKADDSTEAFEE